jgi:hypothetical protein
MQSYPMDPDLITGLAKLAKIERVPMASIVRRALRRELEAAGVVKPERTVVRVTKSGRK